MDILRFFKKLYKDDEKDEETATFSMSDPCKDTVFEILKKNNNKVPG